MSQALELAQWFTYARILWPRVRSQKQAGEMAQVQPQLPESNNTLYINNLNEKIKKEELKRELYYAFSQFGLILDIVAMRTAKMRGQAFVVFDDIFCAERAFREMQSFNFFGKPMRVSYSKSKSKIICEKEGTSSSGQQKKRKREEEDGNGERPSKR